MKVNLLSIVLVFLFTIIFFAGCQEPKVTPTKGYLLAAVDEAVFPIVNQESVVFDSLYKTSKIDLKKVTPYDGIAGVLNGNYKMFVSTMGLNEKQQDFVNKNKIGLNIFKFCYNAIAVIAPKNSSIQNIRIDEIQSILSGESSNIRVVIPQTNTGTYQYISEKILKGKIPKNVEVVPSDSAVFAVVKNSSDKIGLLSFNTVQDSSKIKFLKVGEFNQNKLDDNYYEPHPGLVYKDYYPFKETIFIYLNEKGRSVASGFTTFLTSYIGQKIALGQNLAPAAVPVKINQNQ
ncbi:MAG: PstS family phosphate ABC transporter substrate-binding protein [Ignavibacteriaceae bacterium]|jgi:ABC-type phosphate transport system substrate-binding protein